MNQNLIKLMLSVCAALLIVLLLEWWLIGSADLVRDDEAGDSPGNEVPAALPEIKPSSITAEMYTDMVERPLFIEGRRPLAEADDDEGGTEVASVDDLELVGVYTDDGRMMTLFSKKGRDKTYFKKSQGDEIGGWVVEEIRSGSVILENASRRQTLLLRKPKPHAAPRSPVAPRPGNQAPPPPNTRQPNTQENSKS